MTESVLLSVTGGVAGIGRSCLTSRIRDAPTARRVCDLFLASSAARKQQSRNVRASNQKNAPDNGHQNAKRQRCLGAKRSNSLTGVEDPNARHVIFPPRRIGQDRLVKPVLDVGPCLLVRDPGP